LAGVLSAYGMGLADVRALRQQAIEMPLTPASLDAIQPTLSSLESAARQEVLRQGIDRARLDCTHTLHVKYECTDTTLELSAVPRVDHIVAEFEERYRRQYGFLMPDKGLIVEAAAVEAIGRSRSAAEESPVFAGRTGPLRPLKTNRIYTEGAFCVAAVYDRGDFRPDDTIDGPAVIAEQNATTVIEPGWRAT